MSVKNDSPSSDSKYTPPTKNKKIRNPFDKVLIERLHKPICSPGMCKIYKKKSNGGFRWEIDQACILVPKDIVACSSQFEPSPDPVLEKIAEEATDRYFSQEMVMPSPLESPKNEKPASLTLLTSCTQSVKENKVILRDISAQTVLTLPPVLPPEIESLLQPFCTYTQDQNLSGDYEITANGSLRRKLFFEEHSDIEHYDSEQTDDEIHMEECHPSRFEAHIPVVISPDLSCDLDTKGMKRTFDTPLTKGTLTSNRPYYRNKVLDVVDFREPCFSPIEFQTPKRNDQKSATSSSLASVSISPVNKASSDEEKNQFTSPESEDMATCLKCITSESESEKKRPCFCTITPNKLILTRSASLKESPSKNRKSFSLMLEKRSLSMSSLHRSRSVQKLDFSMDMSVDGSIDNCSQGDYERDSPPNNHTTWSIVEDSRIEHLVKKQEFYKEQPCAMKSPSKVDNVKLNLFNLIKETPIKGKSKQNILSHEISKIRAPFTLSPVNMSLDNSIDNLENPLSLEDKKIDFSNVDLKFLTDNLSQFNYNTNNANKVIADSSVSFKKIDSGFNENTFYANASSYYESAIKPSELTVANISKIHCNNSALKEISNVNWMRVDSGFKDENSADSTQFYPSNELSVKKFAEFRFAEAKFDDKENITTGNFNKFIAQKTNKNDALSMSDTFNEDMTFNCNFSSTPSKNKS